jgi:Uma2 family endonuclease
MSTGLHLTLEEFDRMVELGAFDHLHRKIELIRGEICEMNPAGPRHDDLIMYLTNWSARSTPPEKISVTAQTGLRLEGLASRPEPDLLWVKAGRYHHQHPSAADVRLAIEVAHSSLKADLVVKTELYAEAGIVEYWIGDAEGACIHVFRDPQGKSYARRFVAKRGESLSPLAEPTAELNVSDLFGPTD